MRTWAGTLNLRAAATRTGRSGARAERTDTPGAPATRSAEHLDGPGPGAVALDQQDGLPRSEVEAPLPRG
jgi:hypothetical protein